MKIANPPVPRPALPFSYSRSTPTPAVTPAATPHPPAPAPAQSARVRQGPSRRHEPARSPQPAARQAAASPAGRRWPCRRPSCGVRHRRIGAEHRAIVQAEAARAIEHHLAPLAFRVRWGSAWIRRLCCSLESSATPPPATNRARLPSFRNRITAHPPDAGSGPVGAGIADRSDPSVPRPVRPG